MDNTRSALAWLPIAARLFTHGPTPSSLSLVMITVMPFDSRMSCRSLATAQVNPCSVYPALVSVPVVLQGLVSPNPASTSALMMPGLAPLAPLCPGSMTTTLPPLTGAGAGAGAGAGVGCGLRRGRGFLDLGRFLRRRFGRGSGFRFGDWSARFGGPFSVGDGLGCGRR